jgi:hypothetical protein
MWDELLRTRDVLGFAADDNHGRPAHMPTHDLGWIMVAANDSGRESILSAIRAGRFYSSTGPSFTRLELDGDGLTIECSSVQHAWLLGPSYIYQRENRVAGDPIEQHTFDLKALRDRWGELPFLRLEIRDEQGGRAWTNKLFS